MIEKCYECDAYDFCPSRNEYDPSECDWFNRRLSFVGTEGVNDD